MDHVKTDKIVTRLEESWGTYTPLSVEDDKSTGDYTDITSANVEEMAKKLKCSKELLLMLLDFSINVTHNFQNVNEDLKDLGKVILK